MSVRALPIPSIDFIAFVIKKQKYIKFMLNLQPL